MRKKTSFYAGHFLSISLLWVSFGGLASAETNHPLIGRDAPLFSLTDQNGKTFKLEERRAKGWTILFFYPKAGTPGCTKQVCAFRDAIKGIQQLNAAVYGISSDSVQAQKRFHSENKLLFSLLSDEKGEVANQFRNRRQGSAMANRRTFIIDPELKVRQVLDRVDPAADPENVIRELKALQASNATKKLPAQAN